MAKKIRKSIRIKGKLLSETFSSKEAADRWYSQQYDRKKAAEHGGAVFISGKLLVKDFVEREFLPHRRKNYPQSTWAADEQRLTSHVLPAIGREQLAKVTSAQVYKLLSSLTVEKGLSTRTRDRVRAVISSVYAFAISREQPLASTNPTFGLTFNTGARTGSKEPSFLHTLKDCQRYLRAAGELSLDHYMVGILGLGAGLRKQEMIALRWGRVDFEGEVIEVAEKFIQASGEVVKGTKAGTGAVRYVPMSKDLNEALREKFVHTDFRDDDHFVLAHKDGSHFSPREISRMNDDVCGVTGVSVTVHGLRHSFGREFAERSGNIGALKDILGHSNIVVTQMYSELGKERLKGFKDVVSYGSLQPTKTKRDTK